MLLVEFNPEGRLMIEWCIRKIATKDLKPNPKNPRQISKTKYKQLEDAIANFGLIDKPIVNLDKTLIGGHQRLKIIKKMGIKEVECWMPNRQLSMEEVDKLMVSMNLFQGEWDYDILANEFEPLDLLNWGFTEEQLLGIWEDDNKENGKKDDKKKATLCPACGHEF